MPDQKHGTQAKAKMNQPPLQRNRTWWGLGYIKRKFQEHRARYEAQKPEEKAAWRTANATVAIAWFTVVLAFVGGFTLYEVIEGSADASLASYRELRPYAQINKMDFIGDPFKGEAIKGKASVFNSGRTPAVKVNGCGDIVLKPNGDPMTDDFPCPAPQNPKQSATGEHSIFSLGSGAPGFTVDSPGTSITPTSISIEDFKRMIETGAFRIYFYGYVDYGDIIDTKAVHRTDFCGRYNASTGSLDICEKHNGMN